MKQAMGLSASLAFILMSFLSFGSQALANQCMPPDVTVSQSPVIETQSCMTAGNCIAFDYNPATSQYENFYGFHGTCPGTTQQDIETYVCQRSDGSTYSETDVGSWSFCTAN